MKMPLSSELFSGQIRWPVFLLANKVCFLDFLRIFMLSLLCSDVRFFFFWQFSTALSIARDSLGKDADLLRKIRKDDDMYLVVTECYKSLKYILEILVVGDLERR